jgi:CHAD domain-containing protein
VAARQQLLADIATPRFNAALLRLACWCGSVEADPARAAEPLRLWIEETLRRRYRQVRRGLDGLAGYDVARQHECRLQIKKLRYALEFFASRLPERQTQSHVATLAALQDQLGRLNDIAAAERRLCALAAADGDLAWAAGLVAGWHRQRCPGLLDGVAAGWLRLRRQRAFWQTK